MTFLLIFLAAIVIGFFALRESEGEEDGIDVEGPGPILPPDMNKN
ncbi:MAG TPA: hypothetical protein VFT06_00285 [Flavisolibacter sp.]|nr:hypothetical protein [Flavisolibacter sp.]